MSEITSIVRNPVIAWHNERSPIALPLPGPPRAGPFTVTRSEVVTRASAGQETGITVHIWYAYEPAVALQEGPAVMVPAGNDGGAAARDKALRRLQARAAEWSTDNCELTICACEAGSVITDLLTVLGGAGEEPL